MEPKSLEQLLDCPICFERLDGSNRVLPCQHTFCKKCLEKVRAEFKELRCPECRTKYLGYIKDLPCNILVMRILEQIKQSEKDAEKSKAVNRQVEQSHGRIWTKDQFSITNKRNSLNSSGGSAAIRDNNIPSTFSSDSASRTFFTRNRTNAFGGEANTTTQQGNSLSSSRLILGAVRRNRDDEISSVVVRSVVQSPTSNVRTTVQRNERYTFSPNAYSFSVELKSSTDRNSNVMRRSNKNYVKPSVLNVMSSQNVGRVPAMSTPESNTISNSNLVTPSTSQSILSSPNTHKNYLSFNPNFYSFTVDLRPSDRSRHRKKNYLS